MKKNPTKIGVELIALIVFVVGLANLWALSSTSVMAATSSTSPHHETRDQTAPDVPLCDPYWDLVDFANAGTYDNHLNGVAAVSATDVWAVGSYEVLSYPDYEPQTLVEHWDGNAWYVVSSPSPGGTSYDNHLNGVAAVSANNVWAVGGYSDGTHWRTLVEHWDGNAWYVVSSSSPGSLSNDLNGVAAVSANNVWAVGYYQNVSGNYNTLVEHWNGNTWLMVSSPNPGGTAHDNDLNGIAAVSATDVWAVGYYSLTSNTVQTLVEHWDGSAWSATNFGRPLGGTRSYLYGVAAVSATDVWAVGTYSPDGSYYQTEVQHWDGSQWNWVSSPNVGTTGNYLYGVAAVSATDIWAVGKIVDSTGPDPEWTLVEHWDGSQWNQVPSPNPSFSGQYHVSLYGVAAVSATDVWAVGDFERDAHPSWYSTLVAHYNPCTDITSTPSPTYTPTSTASPTNTFCATLTPLSEGFESGTLGAFTSSVTGTSTPTSGWAAVATPVNSGSFAAFAPDGNNITDQRLTLNTPVYIPGGASYANLTFYHRYSFDFYGTNYYYDGGVLEVSTNGGSTWTDAGANITSGGYNGTLVSSSNPLGFRLAWVATLATYSPVTVNLLPYSGNSILFRFRLGTDRVNVIAATGWYIDDVNVLIGGPCDILTPLATSTRTNTPVNTATPTRTPTATATFAGTPTGTPASVLRGHVTWQGPPAQPNVRQQLPITMTLCVSGTPVIYATTTDSSGFFTVTTSLPTGSYNWRAKGPKYLATAGTTALTPGGITQVEMGLMRAGDTDPTHNNVVNGSDFTALKNVFGTASSVGDLNNDGVTNGTDFTLLKNNFGTAGSAANCP